MQNNQVDLLTFTRCILKAVYLHKIEDPTARSRLVVNLPICLTAILEAAIRTHYDHGFLTVIHLGSELTATIERDHHLKLKKMPQLCRLPDFLLTHTDNTFDNDVHPGLVVAMFTHCLVTLLSPAGARVT